MARASGARAVCKCRQSGRTLCVFVSLRRCAPGVPALRDSCRASVAASDSLGLRPGKGELPWFMADRNFIMAGWGALAAWFGFLVFRDVVRFFGCAGIRVVVSVC
ncbi:hypothetical protein PSAB6_410009 [Paraburkholderia sabiae]|nr:hypothetical protein PSAB6_410009 [Paraburkholderia sabiae]